MQDEQKDLPVECVQSVNLKDRNSIFLLACQMMADIKNVHEVVVKNYEIGEEKKPASSVTFVFDGHFDVEVEEVEEEEKQRGTDE
jgi:hypothetical protein